MEEVTITTCNDFETLLNSIKTYIHKESDLALITKAYEYASKMHENQFRKSGEAYIIHPLNVAYILSVLNVGPSTIIAGLLHDTIEDTDADYATVSTMFGEDVAEIVDGVTKLDKLRFSSLEKQQASNHQKMLLAMAKDIRVIVVKLADRLHNIRTLDAMPHEKQERIAKETLKIYAPLAHRLGMFQIKAELEDRCLKYVNHKMYIKIIHLLEDNKVARQNNISNMINDVKSHLKTYSISKYYIKGRIKNTYSIYKKMNNQDKEFEDIYDILAIRIIVDRIETCYQVLGIIHANYTPIPKRFKDYIAVPKPNMYQSLHTTVIGVDGKTFEIQIRTEQMDRIAEYGIAAHWAYKENVEYSHEREQYEIAQKLKWYADLLKFSEEQENDKNPEEFVNSVKSDLLDANVYVYTPNGEVMDLPKGSTPIDFAYKIHTNIGDKMIGASVNNKIVPLTYQLKTGDIVSVRTNKNSFGPSEDWLKIAKSNHAIHKIRNFLNKQNRDLYVSTGKTAVNQELQQAKLINTIDDDWCVDNFGKNNVKNEEDLYYEVGKGNISAKTILARFKPEQDTAQEQLKKQLERSNRILTTNSETGVVVNGLSNPQLKLGNCCNPIPGDEIVGFITKGKGIVVHHKECKNLANFNTKRIIPLEWATNIERRYPLAIKIVGMESNSITAQIINTVNSHNISILSINAKTNPKSLEAIVKLTILVKNTAELESLIVALKKISNIHNIERENI